MNRLLLMALLLALPLAAQAPAQADETEAAKDADPVVCKSVEATGSRIRKGRVCKPKSVWEGQERQAEDLMKSVDRGNATGIGGDTLPGGT